LNTVKSKMQNANKNMLTAVGMAASSHVKQVIQSKNIIDTGALLNSIDYSSDDKSVLVGSKLVSEDYPVILEKNGRDYIRPGIMNNASNLQSVAERNYKL